MPHSEPAKGDKGDKVKAPLTTQERNIKMSRRMAAKRIAAKKAAGTKVPNAKTSTKRPGLFSLPGMLKRATGSGGKTSKKDRSKGSRKVKGSESSSERSSRRSNRR